jgi:hypothetical protein
MRGNEAFSPWQSFADLAMGLMAVLSLTLVVQLWKQSDVLEDVTEERKKLEAERQTFAIDILQVLSRSDTIVRGQDEAEAWLRRSFEEDECLLRVSPGGNLQIVDASGQLKAAELYEPGETRLNAAGQAALLSCKANFLRLAYALAPSHPASTTDACAALQRPPGTEDKQALASLQRGMEALVLEGNTDRGSLAGKLDHRAIAPIIEGRHKQLRLGAGSVNFAENAMLGSERARQALGHLLNLVQDCNAGPNDALEVLMARVRVESPSFGRYLAGPKPWRKGDCSDDPVCAAARNLSLRIRWRKEELRRPHSELKASICALLANPDSAISKGLVDSGQDLDAVRQQHCAPESP